MSRLLERTSLLDSGAQKLPLQEAPETVQELAQRQLRGAYHQEMRRVSCELHEGVLTLRGRVSSYYLKQFAQELVRGMDGVEVINNRLEVVPQITGP
jgi:osmotically-inducible protein OsmY